MPCQLHEVLIVKPAHEIVSMDGNGVYLQCLSALILFLAVDPQMISALFWSNVGVECPATVADNDRELTPKSPLPNFPFLCCPIDAYRKLVLFVEYKCIASVMLSVAR